MRSSIRGFDMDSGVGGRGSGVRTSTALVVDRTPDSQPLTPSSRVRPQTMAGLAWWRFTRHRMAVAGLLGGAGLRAPAGGSGEDTSGLQSPFYLLLPLFLLKKKNNYSHTLD